MALKIKTTMMKSVAKKKKEALNRMPSALQGQIHEFNGFKEVRARQLWMDLKAHLMDIVNTMREL